MSVTGYRLQLSPFARIWRVVLHVALATAFLPGLADPSSPATVRLGCAAGLALSAMGLRVVLGPAVVVRPEGLRIYTWWPRHRDVAWYRVFAVEAGPTTWALELELNSGERIVLPPTERVDALYAQIEELRQRLDA